MKLLKVVFSFLALSIAVGAPLANAQSAQPAPKQTQAQRLKASLNLTDEQYQQIDAIYKDAAKEKRAVPKTDTDKKAKDAAIDKTTRAKVRALLTPEQQATFDKPPPAKKDGGKKDAGKGKDKSGDKKKSDVE